MLTTPTLCVRMGSRPVKKLSVSLLVVSDVNKTKFLKDS